MERQITAKISRIQRFSVDDGPGIRTTVFFKGCNLSCKWCHNPECIEREEVKGPQLTASVEMTVEQLFEKIIRDRVFYLSSDGGVTLSGGEPLLWPEFITAFISKCRDNGLHTALDTAGLIRYETLEKTAKITNLILYDIKTINSDLHTELTGSDNALILDNLKKLTDLALPIWVRVPVIPGINTDNEMKKIAEFIKPLDNIEQIELLPYHKYGVNKYEQLGIEYQLANLPEPDEEMLKRQYALFSDCRQKVIVSS